MSNDIDILLIDGPLHGSSICVNRTKLTSTYDVGVAGLGVATYERRQHQLYGTEGWHHVAVPVGSEVTDAYIDTVLLASDYQPAWDLNR